MDHAFAYPHLVSLTLVVAVCTLIAGLWAEKRRGRDLTASGNLFVELVFAVAFMFLYCFVALPAILVAGILWGIFGLPETTPDVVMAEAVVVLATLFSVSSNFADVASTYGRPGFWKHLQQYVVFVAPMYCAIMAVAWLGAQVLALKIHYEPLYTERASRPFNPPTLTVVPMLNLVLFVGLFFAASPISYLLRKRGEKR